MYLLRGKEDESRDEQENACSKHVKSRGYTYPSHKADDDAWGDDAGEDHIAKGIGEGNTSSRHVGGHLEQQGSLASLMIFRDL